MAMRVSHGLHDCTHLTPVSVISSFDSHGNILPLYVRIDGENVKIDTACLSSDSNQRILHFNCEATDGEIVRPIKLWYHINDMTWSIPK